MLMSDLKLVFDDLIDEHGDLDVTLKIDGKHEEFMCVDVRYSEQGNPKVFLRPGAEIYKKEAK